MKKNYSLNDLFAIEYNLLNMKSLSYHIYMNKA